MIKCKLCYAPTPFTGTKLCNRCWELSRRIEWDPELTLRVLYELSPLRKYFETLDGIMCQPWCSSMDNYHVIQTVTAAFLLEIPVEYSPPNTKTWKHCRHFPTNFSRARFRRATVFTACDDCQNMYRVTVIPNTNGWAIHSPPYAISNADSGTIAATIKEYFEEYGIIILSVWPACAGENATP